MNLIQFLLSASGSKILAVVFGLVLILGFIWQGQCAVAKQNQITAQYVKKISTVKQKALEDKIEQLKKELENVPQTVYKKSFLDYLLEKFKKKPKDVPQDLVEINQRLNAIGRKMEELSKKK